MNDRQANLSLTQKAHSALNFFGLSLRKLIKFRRAGYFESSDPALQFPPEAGEINKRYDAAKVGPKLFPRHWIRTLATLWHLEKMFEGVNLPKTLNVLEPASQDFSRLPAFRLFFRQKGLQAKITGVEIDPFVPLSGFHSRWDKAHYYISLENDGARFIDCDFFKYEQLSDLILCYYPFVSPEPALAWGLSAKVASALSWVQAFERNLKPGGLAFVVQQGEWEQKDFDEARIGSSLTLVRREILECPFLPSKHPMCASLYQRSIVPA